MKQKLINKQECIPVRCVPAALYRTAGLCPGGVSVQGGLCPRGSLSKGGLYQDSNERAVRILLECILVSNHF